MKCPGCGNEVSDKEKKCPSCGCDLVQTENEMKDRISIRNKNKKRIDKFKKNRKYRPLVLLIAAVAVFVVILIIVVSLSSSKGLRKAEKLSKKLGQPVSKAAEYADIEFVSHSDFPSLSLVTDSRYIFESDKKVRINGVCMPQWAIAASEDIYGNLTEVRYFNFKVLQDNINGERKSSKMDFGEVQPGTSEKVSDKTFDMDPYIISFTNENISKIYKYYYKDKQTDDIQAYDVKVSFSSSGKKVNTPPSEKVNNLIGYIINTESDDVKE